MQTLKDIFVPYEIVNKLREIHFVEPCIAFYEFANPERLVTIIKKEETFLNKYEKGTFTSSNYAGIGCPTYEQVFKWFRDRGFILNIYYDKDSYMCVIKHIKIDFGYTLPNNKTYENAIQNGILKLIELLKEKAYKGN